MNTTAKHDIGRTCFYHLCLRQDNARRYEHRADGIQGKCVKKGLIQWICQCARGYMELFFWHSESGVGLHSHLEGGDIRARCRSEQFVSSLWAARQMAQISGSGYIPGRCSYQWGMAFGWVWSMLIKGIKGQGDAITPSLQTLSY